MIFFKMTFNLLRRKSNLHNENWTVISQKWHLTQTQVYDKSRQCAYWDCDALWM